MRKIYSPSQAQQSIEFTQKNNNNNNNKKISPLPLIEMPRTCQRKEKDAVASQITTFDICVEQKNISECAT